MKRFAMVIGLLAAGIVSAVAADLPRKAEPIYVPPVATYSWTGFYVGLSGGWAGTTDNLGIVGDNKTSAGVIAAGGVLPSYGTKANGGMFGGQVGYNWQMGSWVFGPEFDIFWTGLDKTSTSVFTSGPFTVTTNGSASVDWLGSVRLRGGYLLTPSLLIYATAGGAFGGVQSSFNGTLSAPVVGTIAAAAYDNSSVKWGYTVGGGLEYALTNHWSVKGEYKFFDLSNLGGTAATKVGGTPVSFTGSQDFQINTVIVGVNYKF